MNKKELYYTVIISLALLPIVISAQVPINVPNILNNVKIILFQVFNGLVVIMVVYAAIKYLTAKGEPSKIAEANKALTWAVVGVAVGLLANFASAFVNWLLTNTNPNP
ncbi:MAG: hypothetical protein A3D35_01795 [Candidatus Staskawiczbacteria bacterium RIFCSPHIGHO2_02_FULL_34_9]|uniref:Uncharacterized protein n=1 Tax=Candidatus Staskawiczbacteria bacterium RIFCSPHIGHO2_02_FULL_34_9 TaxID=1802206 RepID=A0A1G2HXQ6_9BACT|nr:MAG: hypothetical protein A3D35_01795 [Candidatus Staskawiczbacteria bacterium RIFCSPHIGHO2_02_FULL_34_9]